MLVTESLHINTSHHSFSHSVIKLNFYFPFISTFKNDFIVFYTTFRRCPENLFHLCLIECGEEITGYDNNYNNSNNNNNDNNYDNNNHNNNYDDNDYHNNGNDFNYITDITGKKLSRNRNINFTMICH